MPLKEKYKNTIRRLAKLQGDPHYVAIGLAAGVFIGFTPTIPFHTILAVSLAFIIRGSKPAAAIGVWISNPLTIPFFYYASYKAGHIIVRTHQAKLKLDDILKALEGSIPLQEKIHIIYGFFTMHVETACIMLLGGIILGLIAAVISYFLTFRSLKAYINLKQKKNKNDIPN